MAESPDRRPPPSDPPVAAADPLAGTAAPEAGGAAGPYQSLYRRYRPQRFDQVRGQDHITRALRNAVRDGRVAHAYLFSGPRGTGKTSTARILAMALNCEHTVDGEPDGTCPSCIDIRRGASVDVQELDAASNRRIDEMRDLLSRVALGTRGRWKIYIIDEVHQLTADAASALLKTLEEPPGHVVFVLATTDPQKVLPTIRSRTIHFEFHLLASDVLGDLLRDINGKAGLGVPPEAIDLVVRRGHGSARDALTVLDQVAAAGAVEDEAEVISQIVDGLADRDAGRVLMAVAEGMTAGRDARRLAADVLEHLRNGFLATMARGLVMLPDDALAQVEEQARRLGTAPLVRAMEGIGQAMADMRDSVDPRVSLEVALVRLAHPQADTSPAAMLARIERLERSDSSGGEDRSHRAAGRGTPAPPTPPSPSVMGPGTGGEPDLPARPAPLSPASGPAPLSPAPEGMAPEDPAAEGPATEGPATASQPAPGPPESGLLHAKPSLGAVRTPRSATAAAPAQPASGTGSPPAPGAPPAGGDRRPTRQPPGRGPAPAAPSDPLPSRDELAKAWGDGVLRGLPGKARAYLGTGRFVGVEPDGAVYAVPDKHLLARAADVRRDAESGLAAHFGRPVPLKLILDSSSQPLLDRDAVVEADEPSLVFPGPSELQDAEPAVVSPEQRLIEAFPGAEEVSP